MARLDLRLLGPPSVSIDGAPAEGFAVQKARGLLFFLAMESQQAHTREALVGLLWPEMPEAKARANLRQALASLREAIGDEHAQPAFLKISRDSLQFSRDSDHWTDVGEYLDLLDACQAHSHRHLDRCASCAHRRQQAIQLYRGGFLAGFHLRDADPFEEWAAIQRERLHRRLAAALVQQATFHEMGGELEAALAMVSRQLELDPWMEEAHRERMRLLGRLGRRSEALAQFEVCRRVLSEELGVSPASETERLYAQIRHGAPTELQPPQPAGPRPLPQSSTPLVGRKQELTELIDWLEDPTHRLVTLTGGIGVGKSRLALAAAERVAGAFSGGVAFIRGSMLDEAAQIPGAILAALAIDPGGVGEPAEQMLGALQERELLLVFDSLEHLLPSARSLLLSILENARRTAILVTSSERIGLQAERCFEVEGMDAGPRAPSPGTPQSEAVELFLERGRRISRHLPSDDSELAEVQRICRLVEGIPLAIELAASAVDRKPCRQIADELESDLGSLAAGHHDLPERHRSLAAALNYSWDLLSESHQGLLRHLSVFRGGWDPEAAAIVSGASQQDLSALADRSLIRQDRSGRFGYHALMQQHAQAMLQAAGEAEEFQHRHLTFYGALAQQAEPQLFGPEQVEWLARLDAEAGNLRQALAWGIEQGETEPAARLCLALARFWMIRGYLAEGQKWIESVLAMPQPPNGLLKVRLHSRAGILAAMQRRFDHAEPHLRTSVELSRAQADTQAEAMALNSLGAMSIERGDYEVARQHLEACLPLWRQLEDKNGMASTLNNLGAVAVLVGECEVARQRFGESLPLFRDLGDRRMIAGVLYNLGDLHLKVGETAQARTSLAESLSLRHEIGDVGGIAETLEGFARLAAGGREAAKAARLLGAAAAMREAVGTPLAPVNQADYDYAVAKALQQLGDDAFRAEWKAGQGLSPSEAVHLAVAT